MSFNPSVLFRAERKEKQPGGFPRRENVAGGSVGSAGLTISDAT